MTGRDLVTASLRLLGVVASGESLEASEAVDGLSSINRMISGWSIESLLIFQRVREEFTLTPNVQEYTIGSSGTFNTSRPLSIDEALLRVGSAPTALDYPINILTLEEWTDITQKGLVSPYPDSLYLNTGYPLATINLYPAPSAAYKLVLWSQKALTEIATLDTVISLPPGYERALVFNGALELAPEYGKSVPDVVAMRAADSLESIKRANYKPLLLGVDSAVATDSGFNFLTGGYS